MRLWHFPRLWKEFKVKENMEYVSTNARIPFRCERCARCCRNLENALMLDPFDIYNLSKHLREQGQEIIGTEDMLAQYAHPNLLEGIYPIFQVNTEGEDHACVFLKDDRCSVYEARAREAGTSITASFGNSGTILALARSRSRIGSTRTSQEKRGTS